MGSEEAQENVLSHVAASRRALLKKLILGSAFAIPAVATFSMSGLGIEKAQAAGPNQSFYVAPGTPGQENCYGQTVAWLEHTSYQEIGYFLDILSGELPPGVALAHGVYSLALQWCRYGQLSCFTAGTLVAMADGTPRAIEQVTVGDRVLASDGTANEVVAIERPRLGSRRLYALNGSDFFVTAEHPFMTEEGWKSIDPGALAAEGSDLPAGRLSAGDRLFTLAAVAVPVGAGRPALAEPADVRIEAVRLESLTGRAADPDTPLFNLRLNGDHTYFANGLLVHNK
jgi:hypothetical protein